MWSGLVVNAVLDDLIETRRTVVGVQDEATELRAIMAADVERLRDGWTRDLDWQSVRREATMLRRLLVNGPGGDLSRLWRLDGRPGQPMITAKDLASLLPNPSLQFATADEVDLPGMKVFGVLVFSSVNPTRRGDSTPKEMTLQQYVRAVSMVMDGQPARRSDIISYVANKLGSAHFDRVRDPKKKAAYGVLDRVRDTTRVGGQEAVFAAVLGIGQTLSTCPDVLNLVGLE